MPQAQITLRITAITRCSMHGQRPRTQAQSCGAEVSLFEREGKDGKLTESSRGGHDQCLEALPFVGLEV